MGQCHKNGLYVVCLGVVLGRGLKQWHVVGIGESEKEK